MVLTLWSSGTANSTASTSADGFSLEFEWQKISSSHFLGQVLGCAFVRMVKFKFLAHFAVDYLANQSCLVLYSFFVNLLYSLIMWLIVSSLSPDSQHFLFCWVLSILALIWLVLMALICAAIWRDSVSLLKFPFLSHVQVLSCEMLFISRLKRP